MSNAVTSSPALTELKKDLIRLSTTLHDIYDLMHSDMSQVGQVWQDGKYQEFVEGFKPQIDKCEEISKRYKEWCVRVLDPTIENVIAVERTDVVGGGANPMGGVSVSGIGKAGKFNLGSITTPQATTKAVPISNGCGSETNPTSFVAASIGRRADAKLASLGRPWKEHSEWIIQGESCDIHDKCYYNGEDKEKCDIEFQQRSRIMGTAVRMAQETSEKSYVEAQIDREKSQRLQSTWEEEHFQSLDSENYRVDINEGGMSTI